MSVPRRSSGGIARKIALASIIISAASGIGLGGISAYGDFRRSFASAIENSERLLRAALPQLESAYWDLDLVATQTTLDRLAEAPLVHSLSLRDLVFAPEDLRAVNIGPLAVQSDLAAEPRSALGRLVPRDWLSGRLEFDLSAPRSPEPIARLKVDLSFAGLYDELGRRAISVVAVTVLQALLIAGILFVLIRSLVIRPLNALSRAARTQREGGGFRLTGRAAGLLSEGRDDEIASLARDFTLTVTRMERYRDNLRDEVDQRTAELVLARNDALAASRAKSAFLANMSHELRTPLNAITGLSELLLAERLPSAAQRHVSDMRSAARQLLGSIDTVLDLSKLEAGRMVFEHVPFAPEEVFDEVLSQTRVLIGAKPVVLEGDIARDVPARVLGDPQRVMQVLLNLTSNAVKFTRSGRIRLRICRRGQWLRLVVMDTGPGIAPEQQEAIFAPFTQGDESTSRRVSGTGLGLSIARQMAEGMGGTLRLRSRPDRGSLFVLDLPLREDAPATPPDPLPRPRLDLPEGRTRRRMAHLLHRSAPRDEHEGLTLGLAPEGRHLLLTGPSGVSETLPMALTHRELRAAIQKILSAGAEPAASEALPGLRERRILLIEDQQINRAVTGALLARAGARVTAAADAGQALEMLAEARPDLILTDLHMPGLDGFATLHELRIRGWTDMPVVASSADVSTATRQACAAAGFAGFVAKPLVGRTLFTTLSDVLNRAQPPLDREVLARNAGGDGTLAEKWLAMLPAEIAGWRRMLRGAVPATEALHAIRGAAIQLGASELQAVCAELPPDRARALAALDRLEAALGGQPRQAPVPPAPPPSRVLLDDCLGALRRHEMAGFDLLAELAPAFPAPRAAELRAAAARLDFRAAAALLEDA